MVLCGYGKTKISENQSNTYTKSFENLGRWGYSAYPIKSVHFWKGITATIYWVFIVYQTEKAMASQLQYPCLENPMDGGAWWAAVHGLRRVGHDWATSLSLFTFIHWRRKRQPTSVFLPGESQGQGSLVGCHLWGHTESDTTEATWRQQQQHCVPGTSLNPSHALIHQIFSMYSKGGFPYLRYEETEVLEI